MNRLRPRSLRSRLLLVVAAGVAGFVALLTIGFNLFLQAKLDSDANDLLRQRAAAHLATVDLSNGRLTVEETADDATHETPIWIYAGNRALERPTTSQENQRAADRLATGPQRFSEVGRTDTRLYSLPLVRRGVRAGTLVAAVSLTPYETSARNALTASVVFALVVVVAVGLAARWAIGGALRPVARMTAEAADRSEHDIDRRFALGEPHDEVTRLAATFDQLLARVAASLRREQRFSAELSHELRTPLAKLIGEPEIALRRERTPEQYRATLEAVRRSAEEMRRTLETLLAAARADAGAATGVSDIRVATRRAVDSCRASSPREVDVRLETNGAPVRAGIDEDVAERILAPLIENGCRYAASHVAVSVGRVAGEVRVVVRDDGPGVDDKLRERIFEPGVRGERRVDDHPGAGLGLGLALARRLARAVEGDVECAGGDGGVFTVRLPAA